MNQATSPARLGRHLFHLVAISATALLALAIPEPTYRLLIGSGALLALSLDLARLRIGRLNRLFIRWLGPVLKASEAAEITGATWLLVAAYGSLYLYGPPVTTHVLLFVAVGDPAAALVGRRAPGPRVKGKSPAGTTAFVIAALAVWAALPAAGLGSWSWAGVIAAVAAAIVELLSLPPDDNFTIPLSAGGAMTLANWWLA